MRNSDLSSRRPAPYGRSLGRTLDPLDYREGWPANGVQLVGAYALDDDGLPHGLDDKKDTLAANRVAAIAAAAAERQKAIDDAAARSKAKTADNGGPPTTEQGVVSKVTTFVKRHPIAVGAGTLGLVIVVVVIVRRRSS